MYGLDPLYRFLSPLGRGSEGEVHLVEDRARSGLLCALKILHDPSSETHRELRSLSRVRHRSIARVLDAGTVDAPGDPRDGASYFTTEYFAGQPFDALGAPFPWDLFETILAEILAALSALNEVGYRHGDLKPAHVLCRPDPVAVKIIDLGHAVRLDDTASPRAGTWPYAAPELWSADRTPGRNTDLYALGMMILELWSGELPITDGKPESWRRWHEKGDRRAALDGLRVEPPPHLLELLRECLSPLAADRPRDASAAAARVRRRLPVAPDQRDTIPLLGRRALLDRLRNWCRRPAREVFLLAGPRGAGKTRVLEYLEQWFRGAGQPVARVGFPTAGITELATHLRHRLGRSRGEPLVLLDELPADGRLDGTAFPTWWKALRGHLGTDLRSVVTLDVGVHSPEAVARRFRSDGIATHLELLGPLDRVTVRELSHHLGRPVEDPTSLTPAYPGELLGKGGSEVPDVDLQEAELLEEEARALRVVPTALRALLEAAPTAVPLGVVLTTIDGSVEDFWSLVADLAGSPDALLVEGTQDDVRVHPLVGNAEPDSSQAAFLVAAAREWARAVPAEHWAALVLERAAGQRRRDEEVRSVRAERKAAGDWAAVAALAATSPGDPDASWDRLVAWSHIGRGPEARRELTHLAPHPEGLPAQRAAEAARVHEVAGDPDAALLFFERAWDAGRDLAHAADVIRMALSLGQRDKALALVTTLEESGFVGDGKDPHLSPAGAAKLGSLLSQLGRFDLGRGFFESALARSRSGGRGEAATVVTCLSGLAGAHRREGDLLQAERRLRTGIRYGRRAGLSGSTHALQANLAGVLYESSRLDEARHVYEALERELLREDQPQLLPYVQLGLGTLQRERGELLLALRTLTRARRTARDLGADSALASILANLGEIYLLLGDPITAVGLRKEVLRLARKIHQPSLICQARAALGAALARRGRLDDGRTLLNRALSMEGPRIGARILAMAHAFLGEIQWHFREDRSAFEHWGRATRDGLRSGRTYYACRGIGGLARLVEARGDRHRARRLLERARRLSEQDGAPQLIRLALDWQALSMDYREHGFSEGLERRFQTGYRLAATLQARELAVGCALVLHHERRRLPEGAAELIDGVLRRLDDGARAALADRLEIVDISAWRRPGIDAEALPISTHRAPRELRERLRAHLDRVRAETGADRASIVIQAGSEWSSIGASPDQGPSPRPVEPMAIPRPLALQPHRLESELRWPLDLGPTVEQAFLILDAVEDPPTALDPATFEDVASRLWLEWRLDEAARREEGLRLALDRMRERGLVERARMETELLSQRLELQSGTEHGDLGAQRPPWVAASPQLREIEARLSTWAKSGLSVLIAGDSGTGKDHLARRLHTLGPRSDRPCVVQNCSALPEALLEAELLGFRKGAFTGAERDQEGLLSRADGGTLLLDHLDELPPVLQGKLLTVLESGRYRPLGAPEESTTDFQLIATCRSLPRDAVASGRLREDLYYRIQGIEIELPPLRDRPEDLPELLESHLNWYARQLGVGVPEVEPGTLKAMTRYDWPGNVRELNNLIQRWLILEKRAIRVEDFDRAPARPPLPAGFPPAGTPWREAMATVQRTYLRSCLEAHGGNQKRTAETLGLSRRHLQNLLDKLDLREKKSSHPPS